MRSQTTERFEVLVTKADQLDDVEATLRQIAMIERCVGILITRHDSVRYTLALSNTAPFGETWEQTLP